MLHTPTAKFILQALEATIYICPEEPGLTEQELVAAGEQFGAKDTRRGSILDSLGYLGDTADVDRNGRVRLQGIAGLYDVAFFGDRLEPDLRKIAAFDFLYDYLVDLADQRQFHNAKATRAEISEAGAGRAEFTANDLQIAVTIWLGTEFLVEKDGLISFRTDPRALNGTRPSDQLAHNRRVGAPARQRPDFNRIYGIVAKIISARHITVENIAGAAPARGASPMISNANKVFVVHGRNDAARKAMFTFLRALALQPMEWNQIMALTGKGSPYIGEVIDAGFKAAAAIVVLLTGDDEARLRDSLRGGSEPAEPLTPQPRTNVIFEAGMAMGRFPDRTILVEIGTLRDLSDLHGRHAARMDGSIARRTELASKLKTAGCAVDMTGTDWHTEGDFAGAVK